MGRLTKYKPTPNSMFPYKLIDDGANTELDAIHKLGKLEDIEEELGIDLITLFKALQNGFYDKEDNFYKDDEETNRVIHIGSNGSIEHFNYFTISVYDLVKDKSVYTIECVNDFWLSDYGKTWALTKKELFK